MHAIALVLLFGTLLNGAQPLPQSAGQYSTQIRAQFDNLVIEPLDYSKLNK